MYYFHIKHAGFLQYKNIIRGDTFFLGYFYLAQSIGDMATSVRNGYIVGNGDINFVTPLS